MNKEVSALLDQLTPHNTLSPPTGYWIEDDEGQVAYEPDGSGAGDWCPDCVDDTVMRLNTYTPGSAIYTALRCDPCGEYDTLPRCAVCGIALAGWPTDYCLDEELDFFQRETDWTANQENIRVIDMALYNLRWEADAAKITPWLEVGRAALIKIAQDCATAIRSLDPATVKETDDGRE